MTMACWTERAWRLVLVVVVMVVAGVPRPVAPAPSPSTALPSVDAQPVLPSVDDQLALPSMDAQPVVPSVDIQPRITTNDYLDQRQLLLAQEQTTIMGQEQVLTADEQAVNTILMQAKMEEMNQGFQTPIDYLPAQNFLKVWQQVEASPVYQLLQQMPKGAALHAHDTALVSATWVVETLTYWPNLYMCNTPTGELRLKFFAVPDTECTWVLVADERAAYPTPEEFDQYLFSHLSLITDNPDEAYPDVNSVWSAFEDYFVAVTDMVMYRPAWEAYLYRALEEFNQDNVLYLEFRGTLPPLYELNGDLLDEVASLGVYRDVTLQYLSDHPDQYFGTRYIYAPFRLVDNATVYGYVDLVQQLRAAYPDFVAGFDMVGQEDKGEPLRNLLDPLLQLSEDGVPVFYHAGETKWMGMSSDENVVDAILLNASRIGHGYAITKHPEVKQLVIEKDVALEVCPISNQVLRLVDDLRNHPAAGLVAEGSVPIVVSSDDPGAWGARGLSHDFYEAFMAFGGAKADLRFLKQLAINSIQYSSLDQAAKNDLMLMWVQKWDQFIQATIAPKHEVSQDDDPTTPTPTATNTTTTTTTTNTIINLVLP